MWVRTTGLPGDVLFNVAGIAEMLEKSGRRATYGIWVDLLIGELLSIYVSDDTQTREVSKCLLSRLSQEPFTLELGSRVGASMAMG